MLLRENPGLLYLIDKRTRDVIKTYSYDSLLFSLKNRRALKEQLDRGNGCFALYCGCHNDLSAEVVLTEGLSIQFLSGTHTSSCISYITSLSNIMRKYVLSSFVGDIRNIPVNFRWEKGTRKKAEILKMVPVLTDKTLSLGAFVFMLNMLYVSERGFLNLTTTDGFLSAMSFELSRYTFFDKEGVSFKFSPDKYFRRGKPVGTLNFVFAKVTGINDSYKSKVYISCQSAEGRYTVSVSRQMWEDLYQYKEGLDLFISGFVTVKEVSTFKKGTYDSFTHSSYGGGAVTRIDYELGSFVLFYTDTRGVICFNEKERELLDNYYSASKQLGISMVAAVEHPDNTRFVEL